MKEKLEKIKTMINSADREMRELGMVMLLDAIKTKSMHRRLSKYISSLHITGTQRKLIRRSAFEKSSKLAENGKQG